MKFVSTRGGEIEASLSEAIAAGVAPDGGLYMPESLPRLDPDDFSGISELSGTAAVALAPFFEGDGLSGHLAAICEEALDLPLPVKPLASGHDHVIELFHGPTAAFKDFGARFLASTLRRLRGGGRTMTIVVATSGDTGAAVAAAFHRLEGFRVVILYPDGRVAPRQEHQLGCFGDNVRAVRVAGTFDDCQRLVRTALADAELQARVPLGSANSISLGRLLPQVAYYVHVAVRFWSDRHEELNLVVPTGNLGNATAAVIARSIGAPIGRIVLSTNANDVLPRFFRGAEYAPAETLATLANAMDVGAPSNFERLMWLYGGPGMLRAALDADAVSDAEIEATIRERFARLGEIHCPHTATAVHVLEKLRAEGATGEWGVVATAHPAKFDSIVEPLIGRSVEVPPQLAAMLAREAHATPMRADYGELRELLTGSRGAWKSG